jgi:hypothetical protein
MNQELVTIKRLIIKKHYAFTEKALVEMDRDSLSEEDILESILNAQFLHTKRSTSPFKQRKKEKVYIIESFTYSGLLIYTKGVIRGTGDNRKFYLLISSKKST